MHGRGHVQQWGGGGDMHGWGHVWQGVCVADGAWQGGHAWWGEACVVGVCVAGEVCVAGDIHGRGACVAEGMCGRGYVWYTVNEWAVHILLECIVVFGFFGVIFTILH